MIDLLIGVMVTGNSVHSFSAGLLRPCLFLGAVF